MSQEQQAENPQEQSQEKPQDTFEQFAQSVLKSLSKLSGKGRLKIRSLVIHAEFGGDQDDAPAETPPTT